MPQVRADVEDVPGVTQRPALLLLPMARVLRGWRVAAEDRAGLAVRAVDREQEARGALSRKFAARVSRLKTSLTAH
jgi:hypothetical protein